jgi:hypothetical protein
MRKIVFTKLINDVSDDFFPKPSSVFLPEWYKKTDSYQDAKKDIDEKAETNGTIKRCVPVFDALNTGYIIPTYCDLIIKKNKNGQKDFITSLPINIQFHSVAQAPYHPNVTNQPYPKWINPWGIKTPKGYSSLIMSPLHSANSYFSILPGVVDTDRYTAAVNFPFVLNDPDFEGLIPAGTPMALIIPFKRDSWKTEIGNEEDKKIAEQKMNLLNSKFFDRYRSLFWERKSYR